MAEALVIGIGEFLVTVTAADRKLMNGAFTPPARPELPVRPEMPDVRNVNLMCGMGIVALNNLECMLPDGVTHSYSINYMERAKEACLMVVHYRSELNVATQSGLAREVFDRFGVALDDDGSKFIMGLVKALPPPSSKKAVPMNGAQAREAAPKCPKTNSKKLFALLEQDTAVWSPSSLPDRRSWPIVPWTEHWEAHASNDTSRWTFAGRLDEDRYDSFDDASPEEQVKIKNDLAAWVLQDTDAIFDRGCEHPGNCDYAAVVVTSQLKGRKTSYRRPERGFQCPFATQAGEARVLCGSHWQLAWAAFKLLKLTWGEYQRYASKIQDVACLSKPCEGNSCNNEYPPHIRLPPSHCCGGMAPALCTTCQSLNQVSRVSQEKELDTEKRYILSVLEPQYLKSNVPCADAHKTRPGSLVTAR